MKFFCRSPLDGRQIFFVVQFWRIVHDDMRRVIRVIRFMEMWWSATTKFNWYKCDAKTWTKKTQNCSRQSENSLASLQIAMFAVWVDARTSDIRTSSLIKIISHVGTKLIRFCFERIGASAARHKYEFICFPTRKLYFVCWIKGMYAFCGRMQHD